MVNSNIATQNHERTSVCHEQCVKQPARVRQTMFVECGSFTLVGWQPPFPVSDHNLTGSRALYLSFGKWKFRKSFVIHVTLAYVCTNAVICACVCLCKHGVLWLIRTVLASTDTHTGKTEKICMHAVINISCTSCHHILTIQLFPQCDSGACYAWRGVLRSQVKNQCDQSTILICTLACEPATQYTNESTKSPPFPSHCRSDYFCNSIIFFRCKVAFINRVSDKIVLVCSGYMLRFALVFVCVCGVDSSVVLKRSSFKCSMEGALHITH